MEGKRMGYKEQYNFWLEDSYFDEAVKKELQEIGGDENARPFLPYHPLRGISIQNDKVPRKA